jgi:pimeloyl-ACP methyl ester carboxylesterase
MNQYQNPMKPYPGLEQWSRSIELPSSGFRIFFYDTGDETKPPVVLLHGLGDEADTWRHVIPLIKDNFRVIAPDLPGFGRSDQAKRNYSIPFFVETVFELLDSLSIQKPILVGHSNGAIISQEFALDHPDRVERLLLIDGTLVSKENHLTRDLLLFLIPGVGERAYSQLRKNPDAAYQTLEPYYHRLQNLSQEDRGFLYQRVNERVWSDGQRRGFLSTLRNLVKWLPAQQKGLPGRLNDSTILTTVLWGEDDRINSISNGQAMIEMARTARMVTVPDAGHNLQQEKAEAVVKEISNFLMTDD